MEKEKMIEELRKILRVYHYDSKEQQMSKDVVTSLENLLGGIKNGPNWVVKKGPFIMSLRR